VPLTRTKSEPIRRNRRYQKRWSSILKAAAKVISRDGFEGAAVREVAAKAKIGLSGIYYYFDGKDELLFALQHHAFSTLVSSLQVRLARCTSPEEKLRAVIDNHFGFFAANMDELKVCVHEIESLSGKYYKDILKIRQEYYRLVRQVVVEITGRSNYRTNLATLYLFGSLNWVYMWYDPEKNYDIKQLSKQLWQVFLNGMKAAK